MQTSVKGYIGHIERSTKMTPKEQVIFDFFGVNNSGNNRVGYELRRKPKVAYINVNLGDKTFILPSALVKICNEINHCKEFLNLGENWNEDGKAISQFVFDGAFEFLINYSTHIYKNYNKVLSVPEISPVKDGSIDMVWDTDEAFMAVNIKEDANHELLGTCYYFNKEDEKAKEGEINLVNVETSTALWMTILQ